MIVLPSFLMDFGIHTDYMRWANETGEGLFTYPESTFLYATGRLISTIIMNIQFSLINTLEDLAYMRFVAYLFTVFNAYLVFYFLTKNKGVGSVAASALVFCVFLVPAMQVPILFMSMFAQGPVTILLAITSYFLLNKVDVINYRYNSARNICYLSAAFILYLFTVMAYPASAMFLLLFTLLQLLFSPLPDFNKTRLIIARDIVFVGTTAFSYILVYNFIYAPILASLSDQFRATYESLVGSNYEISPTLDYALTVLTGGPARMALSGNFGIEFEPDFGSIKTPMTIAAFLTCGTIALGAHFLFSSKHRPRLRIQRMAWSLQMVIIVLVLALFSLSPLLFSHAGNMDIGYRTQLAFSSLISAYTFWVLLRLADISGKFGRKTIFIPMISLLIFSNGAIAARNFFYTSANANRELNFVRQHIAAHESPSQIRTIYFKIPSQPIFYEKEYKREFSYLITQRYTDGFFQAVFQTMGIKWNHPKVIIVRPDDSISVFIDKSSVVIDANEMNIFLSKRRHNVPAIDFSRLPADERKDPQWKYIVDNNIETFWEKGGPFPHAIPLSYYWLIKKGAESRYLQTGTNGVRITKYQVRSYGDGGPFRMPTSWRLQASNDKREWFDLDVRTNQAKWNVMKSQTRIFNISNLAEYKYYRLFVTAAAAGDGMLRLYDVALFADDVE
jgi:hypothetical protein